MLYCQPVLLDSTIKAIHVIYGLDSTKEYEILDTQSLQAFLAVAESDSFSRAAEQLHLTQPAVSKRIATLETQIGARLFDRIGRRVTLTEAGQILLPRARQILIMVDDSRRALTNLEGQIAGSLTLATSHHVGLHRLPPRSEEHTSELQSRGHLV